MKRLFCVRHNKTNKVIKGGDDAPSEFFDNKMEAKAFRDYMTDSWNMPCRVSFGPDHRKSQ